jgi:exonuclease III
MSNFQYEVCLLNVRGLGKREKRDAIRAWISIVKPTIITLTETKLNTQEADFFISTFPGYYGDYVPAVKRVDTRGNLCRGIITLISKKFNIAGLRVNKKALPYQRLDIVLPEITIVAVYLPPSSNKSLIASYINDISAQEWPRPLILMGDWNCVGYRADSNSLYWRFNRPDVMALNGMIQKAYLFDKLNPKYSRRTAKNRHFSSSLAMNWTWSNSSNKARLDRIYVSPEIKVITAGTWFAPCNSDHRLVKTILRINMQRGRGYWRLSPFVLHSRLFEQKVRKLTDSLIQLFQQEEVDVQHQWLILKEAIGVLGRKIGPILATQRRWVLEGLNSIPVDTPDRKYLEALHSTYIESVVMERQELSYWKTFKLYERATKAFSRQLDVDTSKQNTDMIELRDADGNQVLDVHKRLKLLEKIVKVDSREPEIDRVAQNQILDVYTRSFPPDFDIDLSYESFEAVLDKASTNSAPGPDGIPFSFYKLAENRIKKIIHKALVHGLHQGFHPNLVKFRLTHLPKKGRDLGLLSSWRPIALQNADYKLASGMVARALSPVLSDMLPTTQLGFLPNRFIGQLPLTIDQLIKYVERHAMPCSFLFLDFANAFCRMSHDFLEAAFERAGASGKVCKIISSLIRSKTFTVSIAGHISKDIDFEFGTAQGDPSSPLLFIFAVDFLSAAIDKEGIKGIKLNENLKIRELFYADDSVIVTEDPQDLERALNGPIQLFCKATGSRLNVKKSTILTKNCEVEAESSQKISEFPILDTSSSIRYLGFELGSRGLISNPLTELEKLVTKLEKWRRARLSSAGKWTVVSTYAFPMLYYYLYALAPEDDFYKMADNIFNWWLYTSKEAFFTEGEDGLRVDYNKPLISGKRMNTVQPYGWNWISLKTRSEITKIWWWARLESQENSALYHLLTDSLDHHELDTVWIRSFSIWNEVIKKHPKVIKKENCWVIQVTNEKVIPISQARFRDIRAVSPAAASTRLLPTNGQVSCFRITPQDNKEIITKRLEVFMDTIEMSKVRKGIKEWAKRALHHSSPGQRLDKDCFYPNCEGKLVVKHLFSSCKILEDFKNGATKLLSKHKDKNIFTQEWPNLPDPRKYPHLLTLHILIWWCAWKWRWNLYHTYIVRNLEIPEMDKETMCKVVMNMVLAEYRRTVIVALRESRHRKEVRKKAISDFRKLWELPSFLELVDGNYVIVFR